jgi:hypothetical protein
MGGNAEAYMPRELVLRVLAAAGTDVVLVGGQALAFWMDHYGVLQPGGLPAVSRDVDFFTRDAANAAPLDAFARAIRGRAHKQAPETITALIGSAVAPAADDRIYNVDLLHSLVGLERDTIEENAITVTAHGLEHPIRVMHPLHVLQSRNANLHQLREKQDDIGRLQFRLAVDVARKYLLDEVDRIETDAALSTRARERAIFDVFGAVEDYAAGDAARKNAQRYAVFLADALPVWRITAPAFWKKRWPDLRQRMSPAYAEACEARRNAGTERD